MSSTKEDWKFLSYQGRSFAPDTMDFYGKIHWNRYSRKNDSQIGNLGWLYKFRLPANQPINQSGQRSL